MVMFMLTPLKASVGFSVYSILEVHSSEMTLAGCVLPVLVLRTVIVAGTHHLLQLSSFMNMVNH